MAYIGKVTTNSFDMEYCRFGEGKKTFVIVPGISLKSVVASANDIEAAFKLFQKDYTVYLFDRKLNILANYSVYEMADDLALAMKELGINNAYMFGASQGGMIAQCIAIKYPELVNKLALASTVPRHNDIFDDTCNKWISLAENKQGAELNEIFIDRVFSQATLEKFRDFLIRQTEDISNVDLTRFYYLASGNLGFDILEDLSKIKCPVFVVGGKLDNVLGVEGSYQIAEKTNAQIYVYEDYGHALYDEAPDFRQKMFNFFA